VPGSLRIAFEGAARTVTGSRHWIQWGERGWLFDCGLFQGHRAEADRVNRRFRFDPAGLDSVVVSHAHLDHIGNLPTLVGAGFAGPIHATTATADLARVMLPDSAFLMEKDFEHLRKHGRIPSATPLYTPADVERTLSSLRTNRYHQPWDLLEDVRVEAYDAGHILGSALTVFEFKNGQGRFRLGMSGDLGRPDRPILRDPETHAGVDALVMESTYGDRLHPPAEETERQLAEVVRRTAERGGRLMIPAFAVGRTQEVVATLHTLTESRRIPELPIYVDSPLASRTTGVFRAHPECFDEETREAFDRREGEPFGFRRLRYVAGADESRALNDVRGAIIVVAASGMCEGGRILHHLKHGLGDARNTVLFVGFQGEGTLGRRLRDGATTVNILGEPVVCRAEIVGLDGFSAHADQSELAGWAASLKPAPKTIFLVHGEPGPAETLAQVLRQRIGCDVIVPTLHQEFALWN
jgi:metallo-beta-lactamase family protein